MKKSTAEGCLIQHCEGVGPYRKGWCVKHYQQWLRHGDPETRDKKSPTCNVPDCDSKRLSKGMCSMHYQRFLKYGDPLIVKFIVGRTPEERFWEKVSRPTPWDCWLWQAATDADGYGVFGIEGNTAAKAHRISYEWENGPLPEGIQVLHHCDTPGCVNPQHLFAGTPNDNMQDKLQKGRARYLQGTELDHAKLTEVKVKHIRERHAQGMTGAELAKTYNVSKAAISYIINRRTWKHI